uniref:Polyprotein n=1 Tax=Chondrus crispus TaxID=2769 RepID=W0GEX7_CHOCR|nr:polyprotein [Chondrus crispus]
MSEGRNSAGNQELEALLFTAVTELQWTPDEGDDKQVYVRSWLESLIQDNITGDDIHERYVELLPPETLFSPNTLNSANAPRMFKEVRDVIHGRGGLIAKRRGLTIKKALADYYGDPQATKDAIDMARELVARATPSLRAERQAREGTPSSETNMEGMHRNDLEHIPAYADMRAPGLRPREETLPQVLENRFLGHGHDAGGEIDAQTRRHNQYTPGPENHAANAPYTQGPRDQSTVPSRWNSREDSRNNVGQQEGPLSAHAISVLSRLATRFKDRADKYAGNEGENWEDVYSSYINCADQWGVPEGAALRNIETILHGEAKTYYKRKVQANPNYFQTCDEVNKFILDTFHGREAQEATIEHLDSLSMYEQAQRQGSLVAGLRAVRDEIIKHVNLVPKGRQTDLDQKRWLKNAVRQYRWARPTTARAHDMDFARMYATLRSQAIEEERAMENRSERGRYRSKVGDKSLGRRILFGDMYGRDISNPRHTPKPGDGQFRGNCYGCGKRGYRRADCPDCKRDGRTFEPDRKKALKAIHEVTEMKEVLLVMGELQDQYGDRFEDLLGMARGESGSQEEAGEQDIGLAIEDDQRHEGTDGEEHDDEKEGGFIEQFHIHMTDIISTTNDIATSTHQQSRDLDEIPIHETEHSDDDKTFRGACLDTGATTSVCGLNQAKAYASFAGFKYKPKKSNKVFRFGGNRARSMGTIVIRIPIPGNLYVELKVDVVEHDIPLLIGLDALDRFGLYVNNVQDMLVHDNSRWTIPLERKKGHLYYTWGEDEVLFTVSELKRMHQGFYHPSAEKLFNLIRRADPRDATTETRKILNNISQQCSNCQLHAPRPLRFTATIPEGIVFNRMAILDLMWIQNQPLLHVVDHDTHYSAARFLRGESTKDVWETFLHCWVTMYVGLPDILKADSGSVFTSKRWNEYAENAGVVVEISPVENSNALGAGERYHDPLRRIYLKVKHDHPGYTKELILSISNKAMNDTCGPEGLVPTILVFGAIPKIAAQPSGQPTQEQRMNLMQTARAEMEKITARLRMKTILKKRTPSSSHATVSEGDPVLVWRKRGKHSLWTGPFEVIAVHGKIITISEDNGRARDFNASCVKIYLEDDHDLHANRASISREESSLSEESSTGTESASEKDDDWERDPDWDIEEDNIFYDFNSAGDQGVYLTETLPINDVRGREERFMSAKKKELEGLEKMGTWKRVASKDMPEGANLLGTRFALAIKNAGTPEEKPKARLVVQGHTDRDKFNVIHDSTALHQRSIRIIVSMAASEKFKIWSHDITQAYLQSEFPLKREVYLRPPPELKLAKDRVLKLIKPLYGLSESGDYWGSTSSRHHTLDLGMRQTCGDLSLYYRRKGGKLIGLSGVRVDDTLQCGDQHFWEETKRTMDMFKSTERVQQNINFCGIHVDVNEGPGSGFVMSQRDYVIKLTPLVTHADYSQFRSMRAKLAWLTNTRPDIACAVAKLTQVREGEFNLEAIKEANSVVKHVRKDKNLGIVHPHLDPESTEIIAFSDAALGNNRDLSSQIGYVIILRDRYGAANILEYSSKKCRRVTHSSLAGEIMGFSFAFDAAFIIKHDLEEITTRTFPLKMMTDSRALFDMVTRNSYSTERRLMIDMAAIRQSYQRREIDGIAHIPGPTNPADAMTKVGQNGVLANLMQGRLTMEPRQWVTRTQD